MPPIIDPFHLKKGAKVMVEEKNIFFYDQLAADQEGFIEEITRFSQYLNEKTGFVNF